MEDKIAVHYYSLLADKDQIDRLREEIEKNRLPILLVEREPKPVASLFEAETITTIYLTYALLDRAAGAIFDGAVYDVFLKIFRLGKDKILHSIESGRIEKFIGKHFIRIDIQVDKSYFQYFLISNKIADNVAREGLKKLLKVSRKFQNNNADGPFIMDYIRLKKNGKWKKIKDIGRYRMKMKEKERQKRNRS